MSTLTLATIVMFACLFGFLAVGVPVGICLILPLFFMISIEPITTPQFLAQVMYAGVANFTVMAIPFFILSGSLMDGGGLSRRLVKIADSMVGTVTGSLGMVAVIACMFFGAVSGSAPATVAAIGTIMLPEMVRNGYDKFYATGLMACAGGLGVIVPPSFPMVVYGVTTNTSIGTLFIGGLGPALVVGTILIVINYFYCRKHKLRGREKASLKKFVLALKDGWPALMMPLIILGGIYSGVFTPTEAAVVAVVYSLIIGVFYYKELKLPQCFELFRKTSTFVGGTLLTLAPASALGQMFAYLGVTRIVSNFLYGITDNKYIILTLIFGILFIAGMFVQTTPIIVILGPLFLSILQPLGIDAVHFGLMMVLALAIAFVTPPVASNLFVASSMTGIPIDKIIKPMMPFLVGLILALFIVGFFPDTVWFFIRLFGG